MDEFTYAHLDAWIEKQFPDVYADDTDYRILMAGMREQYATDRCLYDEAGWWRCYDDMRTVWKGLQTTAEAG